MVLTFDKKYSSKEIKRETKLTGEMHIFLNQADLALFEWITLLLHNFGEKIRIQSL